MPGFSTTHILIKFPDKHKEYKINNIFSFYSCFFIFIRDTFSCRPESEDEGYGTIYLYF